jgi:hypothetical protein
MMLPKLRSAVFVTMPIAATIVAPTLGRSCPRMGESCGHH